MLKHYRTGNFTEALMLFDELPTHYKKTFSGFDIEIALTLKTGDFERTESAISTVALFFHPGCNQILPALISRSPSRGLFCLAQFENV